MTWDGIENLCNEYLNAVCDSMLEMKSLTDDPIMGHWVVLGWYLGGWVELTRRCGSTRHERLACGGS